MANPALWVGPILPTYVAADSTIANGYYVKTFEPDGAYTTVKSVYKDTGKVTAHSNPFIIDASGHPTDADIYIDGLIDVKVYDGDPDASGALIRSIRNVGTNYSTPSAVTGGNTLLNGSAETDSDSDGEPDNWTETDTGSIVARDTTENYHGAASFCFTGSANGADYYTSDAHAITPGKDVTLEFFVKANNASAAPKITIDWLTAAQAAISTSTLYHDNIGLTPTSWTHKYGFRVTPPSTARFYQLNLIGNTDSTAYNTYFDDVQVHQVSTYPTEAPYTPYGLQISHDTDTAHDLNITAGAVKSDDFTDDLFLPSEITKQADATWAVGDDAGGYESGGSIPASGIFYIWLIKNSGTGHVDVLFSDSATAPTMPSGYDVKRYIGAALTDSSNNIVSAAWKGEYYYPLVLVTEVDDTTLTASTYETATINAPPTSEFKGELFADANGNYATEFRCFFRRTGSTATHGLGVDDTDPAGGALDNVQGEMHVLLDSSSQVDYAVFFQASASPPLNLKVYNKGWTDLLRLYP